MSRLWRRAGEDGEAMALDNRRLDLRAQSKDNTSRVKNKVASNPKHRNAYRQDPGMRI